MNRERRISYQITAQGQLSGLTVTAPSVQRLFIDAGLALSDYRISLDLVKDTAKETLTVTGPHLEGLLFNWLNATALLFNEKKFLPYRIVFTAFDGKKIEAALTGEMYESPRHGYPRPFSEVAAPFTINEVPGLDGHFQISFYLK